MNRQRRISIIGSVSPDVSKPNVQVSRTKYFIWRMVVVLCIVPAWVISLAPTGAPLYTEILPKPNISQNEILVGKLNLSNATVLCPYPYVFSPSRQMCQLKCGTIHFYYNYVVRRVIHILIAIFNTGITSLAIYRWVKIRKEMKFQHHPILVGIIFNLILSFLMGIPDTIGSDIFYCENRDIDYDTFHANPPIQLHIMGALTTLFGVSTRIWFVAAISLILISVSFPMKDVFGPKRNRIIIISIEIVLCIVFPSLCSLSRFTPFTGFELSQEVLLPTSANRNVAIVASATPHLLISGATITIVVLIIYKIHSQTQISAEKFGKPKTVHPIEKRLIFFSIIFFIVTLVISVSLVNKFIRQDQIENQITDFFALVTLRSPYFNPRCDPSILNQTLTLLPPEDQLLVQERGPPVVFEIRGLTIRLMFILVLPLINFPCFKMSCKKKKEEVNIYKNDQVVENA